MGAAAANVPVVIIHCVHKVFSPPADAPHRAAKQVAGSKGGEGDAHALAAARGGGGGGAGRPGGGRAEVGWPRGGAATPAAMRLACRPTHHTGNARAMYTGDKTHTWVTGYAGGPCDGARTTYNTPRHNPALPTPQRQVLLVAQRRNARKCGIDVVQVKGVELALGLHSKMGGSRRCRGLPDCHTRPPYSAIRQSTWSVNRTPRRLPHMFTRFANAID